MIEYALYVILMLFSLCSGIVMVGYIRPKDMSEEEAKQFEEHTNQILYEFSLLEELENEPDSYLIKEQLDELKTHILKMDIPYINQSIVMYYDNSNKSFTYYSNTDIHYKYLDVVARQYVLDNHCKQIYDAMKINEVETNNTPPSEASKMLNDLFVKQQKPNTKKSVEKKMNKFIRAGSIYDYEYENIRKPLEPPKNVNVLDYLKFLKRD
jgi:hypothetical protein